MKTLRILVCGDREWTDRKRMIQVLTQYDQKYSTNVVLIQGTCRGADQMSGVIAKSFRWTVEEFPADWEGLGKKAGFVRNTQMLEEGEPDLVLAFHNRLSQSKGTMMMIQIAARAGVPVRLYTSLEGGA